MLRPAHQLHAGLCFDGDFWHFHHSHLFALIHHGVKLDSVAQIALCAYKGYVLVAVVSDSEKNSRILRLWRGLLDGYVAHCNVCCKNSARKKRNTHKNLFHFVSFLCEI